MEKRVSFWQTLYRFKAHHLVLWLGYYVFWCFVYRGMYPLKTLAVTTGLYTIFNALAFYFVAYYLFPQFLNKQRYPSFFLLLFAGIAITSAGLAYALLMVFRQTPGAYKLNYGIAFVWALMGTITVVGILSAAKLIYEKIKTNKVNRELEKQQLESELQYLKAQVNPHFLFNAINSVYFLIKKDPDKASETLIKLSDLLRFQLYDCSDEKIPIEKELEYIQNFIALEKLRKGEKVKIDFKIEGNLSGFRIAPFMLMPFLENAFKYISNYNDKANRVDIELKRFDDKFYAHFFNTHENVTRNGVGGIGLNNVGRRLELLYPEKYSLTINPRADSFTVNLMLTLT